MLKKTAVLAAMLAAVLSVTTPALAQVQDEVPACEFHDGCLDTSEEQQAANEQEDASSGLTVPGIECEGLPADQETSTPVPDPECDDVDQSLEVASSSNGSQEVNSAGNLQSASAAQYGVSPASPPCVQAVLTAAKEAITKDEPDGGPSPKETFGAALDAARDTGGTREAAAEEAGAPVEDTAAYQAAFEAAKEAGADDETAQEAAEQAVADLLPDEAASSAGGSATSKASKASKVRKGGSGEDIAAAEGKVRKDRASRDDGKDTDGKSKDRKDESRKDDASEEETTDEEEVAASEDANGTGDEDVATTPAESKAPLLLGGVALLSVGGFAALGFARSWPSVPGRRLLRN